MEELSRGGSRRQKKWLQKEWGRKGDCRRSDTEKRWLRQRSLERQIQKKWGEDRYKGEKANRKNERRFLERQIWETERRKRKKNRGVLLRVLRKRVLVELEEEAKNRGA